MSLLTRIERLGLLPVGFGLVVLFAIVGLIPLWVGILPLPALGLTALAAAGRLIASRLALRRTYPGLRRYTAKAQATYPEEFAAVRELLDSLTQRFGLDRRIELLACSNPGPGLFIIEGRTLVVTAGELGSLAGGKHPLVCGEATIAHELGHLDDRAGYFLQHLVYGLRLWAPLTVGTAIVAAALAGAAPLALGAALLALGGLNFLCIAATHLFDAAREFSADRYAARRLANPTRVADGLAILEALNLAAHLPLELTFAGARGMRASLRSLLADWPQARQNPAPLNDMATALEEALCAQVPRRGPAWLSYWLDRLWLAYRTGGIDRHPLMGERVRALIG